jgi:CheY-like chemotaxis protein
MERVASPLSILLVEDEADVRQAVVAVLTRSGFEVAVASHGEEALALLEGGLMPSAILLDLWMPVMDGWAFLERARPTVPVIVISGVGEQIYPLPPNVSLVLTKPVGIEELTTSIERVLKKG